MIIKHLLRYLINVFVFIKPIGCGKKLSFPPFPASVYVLKKKLAILNFPKKLIALKKV